MKYKEIRYLAELQNKHPEFLVSALMLVSYRIDKLFMIIWKALYIPQIVNKLSEWLK